jgi:hypothetical protein
MAMTKAVSSICLKFDLVTGAAGDTNMAVTGIKTTDEIVRCLEFATSTNDPTDRTATTSITSDGNIQCSVATTNDKLDLIWIDRSA